MGNSRSLVRWLRVTWLPLALGACTSAGVISDRSQIPASITVRHDCEQTGAMLADAWQLDDVTAITIDPIDSYRPKGNEVDAVLTGYRAYLNLARCEGYIVVRSAVAGPTGLGRDRCIARQIYTKGSCALPETH